MDSRLLYYTSYKLNISLVSNGTSCLSVVNGQPEVPDCSACKYNDNIGYYKSRNYCSQYWMVSQCVQHYTSL